MEDYVLLLFAPVFPIVLFAVMSTLTSPVTCHTFGEALDEVQWHLHAIRLVELRANGATAYFFR
jgi:hypothetical protein